MFIRVDHFTEINLRKLFTKQQRLEQNYLSVHWHSPNLMCCGCVNIVNSVTHKLLHLKFIEHITENEISCDAINAFQTEQFSCG
jgi:hypothetical protein